MKPTNASYKPKKGWIDRLLWLGSLLGYYCACFLVFYVLTSGLAHYLAQYPLPPTRKWAEVPLYYGVGALGWYILDWMYKQAKL